MNYNWLATAKLPFTEHKISLYTSLKYINDMLTITHNEETFYNDYLNIHLKSSKH